MMFPELRIFLQIVCAGLLFVVAAVALLWIICVPVWKWVRRKFGIEFPGGGM